MKVASRTDRGKERRSNEDSYFSRVVSGYTVLAVADGMGGHAAGDVASSLAIDEITRFAGSLQHQDRLEEDIAVIIKNIVQKAGESVYRASLEDPGRRGMGTTLTLGIIHNNRLTIGHVGDSRVYRISSSMIEKLTQDHSLVEEMVKDGRLSREEAQSHSQRHIITRALGTSPKVEVDVEKVDLKQGDYLLFCTDGLTSVVTESEILKVVNEKGDCPQTAVDYLVQMANDRGGPDNITLILVSDTGRQEANDR